MLDYFYWHGWRAPAADLNRECGSLSYRARISDLRIKHGLKVVACPPHPKPGEASVYVIPEEARARAVHLWRFRTLEGYTIAERQGGFF